MSEERDRYLWDRSGEPDPEVQRLEALLGRHRLTVPSSGQPRPPPRRRWALRGAIGLAAAAVACAAAIALLPRLGQPGTEWRVTSAGGASIGGVAFEGRGALRVGEALETGAGSHAELHAGAVGKIEVAPGSLLRLVQSSSGRHRLTLERGRIAARLWSPPFTFGFSTPSADAFDLGCAFSLEASGEQSALHVSSGWVTLQWGERQELIPAGASAIALRGRGPGTPVFDDAPGPFKAAVRSLDFGPPGDGRRIALETLLQVARRRDVYTLLRLRLRAGSEERDRIYTRASELWPPPAGMTREVFLEGDPDSTDPWVHSLGLGDAKRWWIHVRDVLPL